MGKGVIIENLGEDPDISDTSVDKDISSIANPDTYKDKVVGKKNRKGLFPPSDEKEVNGGVPFYK